MFEEKYRHMYRQISPNQVTVEGLLRILEKKGGRKERHRQKIRRLAAAAAVMLAFLISVPAMAATVPGVHVAIYTVLPNTAQFFTPVKKSCVYDGIKLEVESAWVHEDTAEMYVTLQDLEGNRVDDSTDFYDSYNVLQTKGGAYGCEFVDYDEKTGKARFLIRVQQWDGAKICSNKITFYFTEFLSHKKEYEGPVAFDLTQADRYAETKTGRIYGIGGLEYVPGQAEENAVLLAPKKPLENFPVEGMNITGAGYVDGRLHIQTVIYNRMETDNHGYVYLQDQEGNQITSSYSISACLKEEEFGKKDYQDFVFDVPFEKLGNYGLYGRFVVGGERTKGFWQVTFPVE